MLFIIFFQQMAEKTERKAEAVGFVDVGKYSNKFETLVCSSPAPFVLRVEINRPKKRNAMNRAFWKEIRECFQSIGQDSSIRSVLLTAAGPFFTAGLDMNDHVNDFTSTGEDVAREASRLRQFVQSYQVRILFSSSYLRLIFFLPTLICFVSSRLLSSALLSFFFPRTRSQRLRRFCSRW